MKYSIWIHIFMAVFVGGTLVFIGLFLTYRVKSARDMVREVDNHLINQDKEIKEILRILERIENK